MAWGGALAGGFWLGTGLMYLADPISGRRRRAIARDKLLHYLRVSGRGVEKGLRDLGQRTSGRWHELQALREDAPATDEVLKERVRAKAGRLVHHSRELFVAAENGCVTLRGKVAPFEKPLVLAAVRLVPGVRDLRDELEFAHFDEVPRSLKFTQRRWKPATKLVASTAGGLGLALYAGYLARA